MTRRRARPSAARPQRRALSSSRRLDPTAWLWIGAGVLFLVVGALVGAGLYTRYYVPPRETVLEVGDRQFKMEYFADRLQYYLSSAATEGRLASTAEAPNAVLNELEREELLRQFAAEEGLSVSDAELDQALRQKIADLSGRTAAAVPTLSATLVVTPPASPTPTPAEGAAPAEPTPSPEPTPTPEPTASPSPTASPAPTPAFASDDDYRRALEKVEKETRLSESEIREIVRAELLQKKLEEKLRGTLPAQAVQAQLDVIFLRDDRAKVEEAKKRLDAGEEFSIVQADVGSPPQPPTWVVKEMLLAPFQEPAFSLPVGTHSGIIATDRGFGIIKVTAREERSLEETHKQFLLTASGDDWIAERRSRVPIKRQLNTEKTTWALEQLQG